MLMFQFIKLVTTERLRKHRVVVMRVCLMRFKQWHSKVLALMQAT